MNKDNNTFTTSITKEQFINTINDMQTIYEKYDKIVDTLYSIGIDIINLDMNPIHETIKLLEDIMGCPRDYKYYISDISYFVYELDFGRNYKDGCIKDKDGNNIKLETPEDLWNVLVSECK